jgi:hypothetical protein
MTQELFEEDGRANTPTKQALKAHDEPDTPTAEELTTPRLHETSDGIVPSAAVPLANLASEASINKAVDDAIARSQGSIRMKSALLSMTNKWDWYSMRAEGEPDGVPYLAETGATKVMHAFGIQIATSDPEKVPNPEGGYEFVFYGRVRALAFSDAWFPVVGSRWSEDGFFTQGGKRRADPGDVRKSAMTNLYNRAIKLACGIKSISWDELEDVPHLKGLRNQVRKIGFTGGAGGASAPAGTIAGLQKGPHIMVSIPYQNMEARTIIKNLPRDERTFTGKEGEPQNVWIVKWSKTNFNRMADLNAAHGDVKIKPVNVPADELP